MRPALSIEARKSSSVHRGSVFKALSPLASTSPRAEFLSNCETMSGPGILVLVKRRTSASTFLGTILSGFKLTKRSITIASAMMELAIKGQIGQPAACMIDSKGFSSLAQLVGGVGARASAPTLGSLWPMVPALPKQPGPAAGRARRCPTAGSSSRTVPAICGQTCGQHLGVFRKWASPRAAAGVAAFFSADLSMHIKHLALHDKPVTTARHAPALPARCVDFSCATDA